LVLIVEDDFLLRFSTAEDLRSAGYEVAEAADAGEAIAILDSGESVDVVFTDVRMPGALDGLMLVHWVREHHPGTEVLVTSGEGDAAVSSGLVEGEGFFSKPYALKEVGSHIRSVLEVR
jgi:DNA-binding NtrC family response regulator